MEALVALGGIQLLLRKAAIDGVVVREVCAGSAKGAVLSDNPTGAERLDSCCAHIKGIRPQRAIKAISTIIYLMEVRLSLKYL
jgi:hypothetical protein